MTCIHKCSMDSTAIFLVSGLHLLITHCNLSSLEGKSIPGEQQSDHSRASRMWQSKKDLERCCESKHRIGNLRA